MHSYGGCGWHHSAFSFEAGQALYRWRVNQVLDRSDLGLRLADEGEDTGRLVAVNRLCSHGACSIDGWAHRPWDRRCCASCHRPIQRRSASEHDKRSATVALAGVLEERRPLLKAELVSKDEGALFMIANQFAVRHRNEAQKADYDPAFLDWFFWWYLVTIEADRSHPCPADGPQRSGGTRSSFLVLQQRAVMLSGVAA